MHARVIPFLNSGVTGVFKHDDGSFFRGRILLSLDLPYLLVYSWLQYKSFLLSCIKILLVLSERNPLLPLLAKFSPFRLLRAHKMEE